MKLVDLSPYFGDDVDLETGQKRWDAFPYKERKRLAWAIITAFALHAGIKLPKNKKRHRVPV
jgi:hypothetical protein